MHLIPNDRRRAQGNHSFKDINGSFLKDDRISSSERMRFKFYSTLHQQFKGGFLGQSRNAITKRIKEQLSWLWREWCKRRRKIYLTSSRTDDKKFSPSSSCFRMKMRNPRRVFSNRHCVCDLLSKHRICLRFVDADDYSKESSSNWEFSFLLGH